MLNKIILGTVQFGLNYGINNSVGKTSREDAFKILNEAYSNGITTLDTADAYGEAAGIIGEFIKAERKCFKVISKVKLDKDLNLLKHVEESLGKLGIENFFGYLFHSFNDIYKKPETLREVTSLKKAKLISNIGTSVYTNDQFENAIEIEEIDIIQLPYNLLDNINKRGNLIRKAKKNGKIIHTRSVFLQGLFFKPLESFPENLYPLKKYINEISLLAQEKSISIETLALAYPLNNPLIDGVLFGVETLDQLRKNIESINKIASLSVKIDEEINKIEVVDTELLNPANWHR